MWAQCFCSVLIISCSTQKHFWPIQSELKICCFGGHKNSNYIQRSKRTFLQPSCDRCSGFSKGIYLPSTFGGTCRCSFLFVDEGWSVVEATPVTCFLGFFSQCLFPVFAGTTFLSASTLRTHGQIWWAGSRFCSRNQTRQVVPTTAFVQFRPCPRGEQRWWPIRLLVRRIKGWLQLIRIEQRSRSDQHVVVCKPELLCNPSMLNKNLCSHFSWAELKDPKLFLHTQKTHFSQILSTDLC